MKLRSAITKVAGGGMLAASLLMATPLSALACTQVYVGRNLTTTGDTYVGRAEDYSSRYAKAFGIQKSEENPTFTSYEVDAVDGSGFQWTYQGTSYRYTYVRDLPSEWGAENSASASKVYSEAGTNERGVSVSATLTTSMNKQIEAIDPGLDTGIGEYNLADVVLATADTARDGVKRLGAIIDEHGSYDCNQIIIADNTETFIFCQLSGHQWIALKMGDNVASVNPNMGDLQYKVDLDDENQCLHSADIVKMPEEAGLLKTFDDGTPNIAKTYGPENSGAGQNTRYAQGRAYFGAALDPTTDYTVNENGTVASLADPQLTFTPGVTVDTFAALRSLAARGEQVDSLNANLNSSLYAIGNNRTVENHIFQIRSGLSADIATVQWEALSRAEFSLYLPSYSALLTEVPADYFPEWTTVSSDHTGRGDSVDKALEEEPGKNLDYVLMDINTLAYNNRASMAANTRAYLDAVQKSIIAQQDAVDAVMQATPAGEERTALANKAFAAVTEQAYTKVKALLDEMRAYVKAGDTSAAFVPSDYDAATGSMKTGLAYGAAIVAPVIASQPASATYTVGDDAAALSVSATVADGVEGSDAQLSYQWFEKAADGQFAAIEGATSATFAVKTSMVGTWTYRVTVTNAAGLSVTSDEATITVNEAKKDPEPTPQPDPDAQKPSTGTTKKPAATKKPVTKAKLPHTGDDSMGLIGIAAAAGVIVVGAGIFLARRRS